MRCTNPQIGKWLVLYQFGQLSSEEKKRFEAHLLECDRCCQEAYVLGPVVERLKANPRPFLAELAALAPPPRGIVDRLTQTGDRIFSVPKQALGWALTGVVIIALITLVFFLRGPAELRDLAEIEPHYFHAINAMGPAAQTEAERLFLQGMTHYGSGEYNDAIVLLERAAALDSSAAEFQFYLGVTNLLLGRPHAALAPLQQSIARDKTRYEPRARWYMANAYLELNDAQQALTELQRIARRQGEYAAQAREMIAKIAAFVENK